MFHITRYFEDFISKKIQTWKEVSFVGRLKQIYFCFLFCGAELHISSYIQLQ